MGKIQFQPLRGKSGSLGRLFPSSKPCRAQDAMGWSLSRSIASPGEKAKAPLCSSRDSPLEQPCSPAAEWAGKVRLMSAKCFEILRWTQPGKHKVLFWRGVSTASAKHGNWTGHAPTTPHTWARPALQLSLLPDRGPGAFIRGLGMSVSMEERGRPWKNMGSHMPQFPYSKIKMIPSSFVIYFLLQPRIF